MVLVGDDLNPLSIAATKFSRSSRLSAKTPSTWIATIPSISQESHPWISWARFPWA